MKPQLRTLNTINRQPVDRVPIDIWLTPEVMADLKQYTGKEDEYEMYQALGIDKIAWLVPNYPEDDSGHMRDAWGVESEKIQSGEAVYYEVSKRPLEDMEEPEELEDYPWWPDPDKYDYTAIRRKAERARAFEFATIGPWVSHFEVYCRM